MSPRIVPLLLALTLPAGPVIAAEAPRKDAEGEPLPPGAVARLGSVRFLHAGDVNTLTFSRDGKELFASAREEDCVRAWDTATGREVRRFVSEGSAILCVALSPDGKHLAAGDNSSRLSVWEAATGKLLFRLEGKGSVYAVAWSPDGKVLAASDTGAVIRLLKGTTGEQLRRLTGHEQPLTWLAFSPDGKVLISAAGDKTFRVWDMAAGKELRRLEGGAGSTSPLTFSPDGRTLAGTCGLPLRDGQSESVARLWDPATGKKRRDLDKHTYCCVLSSDGRLVATEQFRRAIRLWDPATGEEVRSWDVRGGFVNALAFAPDGKVLASGDANGRVRLWEVASGKEVRPVRGHRDVVQVVAFAPDGKAVASGGADLTVRVWQPFTGCEVRRYEGVGHDCGPTTGVRLAYTPDGKRLVAAGVLAGGADFRVWDAATGKELTRAAPKGDRPRSFAMMPDGKELAVAPYTGGVSDGGICFWDAGTGKLLRRLGEGDGFLAALAPSPDGKMIAYAEAQDIGLRDAATGKELVRFQGSGHHTHVALAFSPNGDVLASAGASGPVRLWGVVTGRQRATLAQGLRGTQALAWSPDATLLAVASRGMLSVWDVPTRREVRRFRGHLADIRTLAFSPDGRVAVTGSDDSTLVVWDLTGRLKDGRLPARALTAAELEARWKMLGGADAAAAQGATWDLAACPQAPAFLAKHLKPAAATVGPGQVERLVADLDADSFEVREQAERQLANLGRAAEPALRKALASNPSAELRTRAGRLLRQLDDPALEVGRLRELRAVAALERAGGDEARRLLEILAKGAPEAALTRAAKGAAGRLARRAEAR